MTVYTRPSDPRPLLWFGALLIASITLTRCEADQSTTVVTSPEAASPHQEPLEIHTNATPHGQQGHTVGFIHTEDGASNLPSGTSHNTIRPSSNFRRADISFETFMRTDWTWVSPRSSLTTQPNPPSIPHPVFDIEMAGLLKHYFLIQTNLSENNAEPLPGIARGLTRKLALLQTGPIPGATREERTKIRAQLKTLAGLTSQFAQSQSLIKARAVFRFFSKPLMYLVAFHYGIDEERLPYAFYCPRVRAGWLQSSRIPANPYLGANDRTCGIYLPWQKRLNNGSRQPEPPIPSNQGD